MSRRKHGVRSLKKEVKDLLMARDFNRSMRRILSLPPKAVINPLFSFLLSTDPLLKWRAVSAMGRVVAHLASTDMEGARVIVRRLMWQLNDESGGIGWGCPEAMGEILACHRKLAEEFAQVLVSYIREDGNFLEYGPLQSGALWAVGRLAEVWPHLAKGAEQYIQPFLSSSVPQVRGNAVWAIGNVGIGDAGTILSLVDDTAEMEIFRSGKLVHTTVGQLAKEALSRLNPEARPHLDRKGV